jgi:hypothetical protein
LRRRARANCQQRREGQGLQTGNPG